MIDEGKSIEVNASSANAHYEFSVDELKNCTRKLRSKRNEIMNRLLCGKRIFGYVPHGRTEKKVTVHTCVSSDEKGYCRSSIPLYPTLLESI